MYNIFYAFLWLITWLPLQVLHVLSDIVYLVVYYIVGYRREVVRKNLENSFPLKTSQELLVIERRFYRHFCDIFIETIYEMHARPAEILKRFHFVNPEIITEQYDKGKSVLVMTAHYGNWEWASAFSLLLPDGKKNYGIYKQLKNKNFDKLMIQLRQKFTGGTIETQELFRTMIHMKNNGMLATFGMISDQTPTSNGARHWMTFLNQDTPVHVGTEQMARKFNYPVFFFQSDRIKRGYYQCTFVPISLEPKLTAEFEITEKYMHLLEKSIVEKPEFWLWSHKRWKHKRTINEDIQQTNFQH